MTSQPWPMISKRTFLNVYLGQDADHGHRRTNDDKRRAVDIVLADPTWAQWSDSEIATRCAVDHKTVATN
jgi:hypothetical protein